MCSIYTCVHHGPLCNGQVQKLTDVEVNKRSGRQMARPSHPVARASGVVTLGGGGGGAGVTPNGGAP